MDEDTHLGRVGRTGPAAAGALLHDGAVQRGRNQVEGQRALVGAADRVAEIAETGGGLAGRAAISRSARLVSAARQGVLLDQIAGCIDDIELATRDVAAGAAGAYAHFEQGVGILRASGRW